MDVAVNEICRPILLDQFSKAFKTPMTKVFSVMDAQRRGMCDHDIDAADSANRGSGSPDYFLHFGIGELVGAAVVPMGSSHPQQSKTAELHDPSMQIHAALRRIGIKADIVIAHHIIQRYAAGLCELGQVFGWQISTGQNQIWHC